MSGTKRQSLVEGVDYYMEGTKFVFTEAYHLKRGYCCNSRCRHCPYGRDSVPLVPVELLSLVMKRPLSGG
jgi:hypothetical protein